MKHTMNALTLLAALATLIPVAVSAQAIATDDMPVGVARGSPPRRPVTTIVAPAAAIWSATASPIPAVPPTITARQPATENGLKPSTSATFWTIAVDFFAVKVHDHEIIGGTDCLPRFHCSIMNSHTQLPTRTTTCTRFSTPQASWWTHSPT